MKNKHALIMVICCLLPVVGFSVAFFLGIPLGTLGTAALFLLCPLGHILMMRSMGKKHAEHNHMGEANEVKKT